MTYRLLDLFCGAGGAARGYVLAGFDVTGIDRQPQPHYRESGASAVYIADVTAVLEDIVSEFDAIHASPPCQRYSAMTRAAKSYDRHPDMIAWLRDVLVRSGKPYVIENVPGAPLRDPILLCGTQFGLRVYRHRLFESNVPLVQPHHPTHTHAVPRAGRGAGPDGYISVAGHFADVAAARRAMGIPWMTRDELAQAIPPAYTKYIGQQIRSWLDNRQKP